MTDADTAHRLKAIKALVQTLMDSIDDMLCPPVATTGDRRLNAPWLSQLGVNADYAPGDCGAACVAMLVGFFGHVVTVDDVSRATSKAQGFTLLSFQELTQAAARYNVRLEHVMFALDDMCRSIDAGKPTIALVNYKSIPQYNRYSASYNAGHWLLVVGYDADCITYHDPYWLAADRGAFRSMTRDDFTRAYTTIAPGNTRAPHALRVV